MAKLSRQCVHAFRTQSIEGGATWRWPHDLWTALVVFNWALFGLAVFGLVMVFDPLGSKRYHALHETPSVGESLRHRKGTSVWQRRFRWAFCWLRRDEHGHEAFQQVSLRDSPRQTGPPIETTPSWEKTPGAPGNPGAFLKKI